MTSRILANIGLNLSADKCSVQRVGRAAGRGQKVQLSWEEYPIANCHDGLNVWGAMVTLDGIVYSTFKGRVGEVFEIICFLYEKKCFGGEAFEAVRRSGD